MGQEFERIYQENAKVVMKFLLSLTSDYHLAEELTQETFYRAYRNIKGFQGTCKLNVWLCQIAKNLYLDTVKSSRWQRETELTDNHADTGQQLRTVEEKDSVAQIYRMIHQLEEPYKEVFLLRYNGDLSLKEIGALFQKSENWARVTYYRAKEKLKKSLEEGQ
ncbi:MAG: sigma-70 family RNA polymerase sigma factor [Lachnospiraceae bacterium]|nr:sigma-70 family RNA polymerase sigma factor [Lachnospiraceae bacterium]